MLRSFAGGTPFTTDSKGFTLLHYAACNGHRLAVQMVKAESGSEMEYMCIYCTCFFNITVHAFSTVDFM